MMDMSEEQATAAALKHTVGSDQIRRILAEPRKMPADLRKDIAMRLISSLSNNKNANGPPNGVSDAVNTVTGSKEWARMKDAAGKNDVVRKLILRTVLKALLDSMDGGNDISEAMRASWDRISRYIGTMDALSSLCPVSGSDHSIRDAHSELVDHTEAYENLMERNDDLEWMAEIMRFMESELRARERKDLRNNGRNVLMVIDTSKSMYGEPDMIAKSLALAIAKQMIRIGKRTEVLFSPSHLPAVDPSNGRDMIHLISHRYTSETSFTDALRMLMKRMKQGSIAETDIILASKGTGILNDPDFTRDWEAFKTNNGVRVITAVTGGSDACALTELSDHVMIFNDGTIHGKTMEFAGLIDELTS